jgi:hypothetical protein
MTLENEDKKYINRKDKEMMNERFNVIILIYDIEIYLNPRMKINETKRKLINEMPISINNKGIKIIKIKGKKKIEMKLEDMKRFEIN